MKNTYNQYRMVPIDTKLVSVIQIINDWTTWELLFSNSSGVNKSAIYFIKKNEDTQGKPVLCRVQKFLVQVVMVTSTRWMCMVRRWRTNGRQSLVLWWGRRPHGHTTIMQSLGGGENCSFHASEGWCEKFKKLMSLHNLKWVGEWESFEDVAGTKYIRR